VGFFVAVTSLAPTEKCCEPRCISRFIEHLNYLRTELTTTDHLVRLHVTSRMHPWEQSSRAHLFCIRPTACNSASAQLQVNKQVCNIHQMDLLPYARGSQPRRQICTLQICAHNGIKLKHPERLQIISEYRRPPPLQLRSLAKQYQRRQSVYFIFFTQFRRFVSVNFCNLCHAIEPCCHLRQHGLHLLAGTTPVTYTKTHIV
jgi:hypothetical protein